MGGRKCEAVEGCPSRAVQYGLCNKHFLRAKRASIDLEKIDRKARFHKIAEDGTKLISCGRCDRFLPESNFNLNNSSSSPRKFQPYCRICWIEYRYNMRPGQLAEMLALQGFACAICRSPIFLPGESTLTNTACVDHDHACCPGNRRTCGKCNRSLLCGHCNRGLGNFREDIESLRMAIKYLEEWS